MRDLRGLFSRFFWGADPGAKPLGTIYCDRGSNNAKDAFRSMGFPLAADPAEADLLWIRSKFDRYLKKLREDALLNHLPSESHIVDKGRLTQHLKKYDRLLEEGGELNGLRLHDFYQESYRLDNDEDRSAFLDRLPAKDDPRNIWIFKPRWMSKGIGIKILWKLGKLKEQFRDPERHGVDTKQLSYIVQRYIPNPLLLNERKSEIRVYWLIASLDPLLVLMYPEGTVRLNTLPFQLDEFENTAIHVTNVYQQKKNDAYDPDAILKWTFPELEDYLVNDVRLAEPNFLEKRLRPRLKRIIDFVVRAGRRRLTRRPERGQFFALYGADLILDDQLNPWLTEIQEGPGLSFADPTKEFLIPAVLDETARIAMEVRDRKRAGESLAELDARDRFEWVINESTASQN